ncbi:MAG: acetyltransferase [Candidatus Omnitrophica bacterium]|nr:acetyltransferase [Candidatus Omnitrophota bacterium]
MKKLKKILLVGGGGHCKVIIDAIRKGKEFEVLGIVDENPDVKEVMGVKVIGQDKDLSKIFDSGCKNAFISVGSVGDAGTRIKLGMILRKNGFYLPLIKHVSAVVAENTVIGGGTFIAAGVTIGPGTTIGDNAIINTASSVDHDCQISDFVHIAPGATLSGSVKIGQYSHIGTGAAIIERIVIGRSVVIGAGSVVVSDIPSNNKAFGNPCKIVNKI